MSGRPSPLTSATAAPAYQPYGAGERLRREGAVAVVPEDVDTRRGRDDQVGVAVAVQVGRDAAGALDADAGVGRGAHVDEPAVHVLEERALRQAAVAVPHGHVGVGVGVDGEEDRASRRCCSRSSRPRRPSSPAGRRSSSSGTRPGGSRARASAPRRRGGAAGRHRRPSTGSRSSPVETAGRARRSSVPSPTIRRWLPETARSKTCVNAVAVPLCGIREATG